jgi:hypothetical protein
MRAGSGRVLALIPDEGSSRIKDCTHRRSCLGMLQSCVEFVREFFHLIQRTHARFDDLDVVRMKENASLIQSIYILR